MLDIQILHWKAVLTTWYQENVMYIRYLHCEKPEKGNTYSTCIRKNLEKLQYVL